MKNKFKSYPAPLFGNPSLVNKLSQLNLLNKSFNATNASASAISPATTAMSLAFTECNLLATSTKASSHPQAFKLPSIPRTYGVVRRWRFKPS